MSVETLTSYDVYVEILEDNPQIDLIFPFSYSPIPHRKPGERIGARRSPDLRIYYSVKDFLSLLEIWKKGEPRDWERTDIISGITSIVGVGIAQKQEWEYVVFCGMEDWELVKDWEPKEEKSLLFVDMEVPYSDKTTGEIIEKIKKMGIDGYLLKSDRAYHFVSDELTSLDELPARYGKFINAFTGDESHWQWVIDIGNALIRSQDREDVKQVCNYILNRIGHYGEKGERWAEVDLRHIAHSLLEFPVLRISSKEGYPTPPILLARFKDGEVKVYLESLRDLF